MYKTIDISVVIPTYNRAEDLRETLKSILKQIDRITEVVIVDQSKNGDTKNLVKNLKNRKIKYFYSKTPAITIARNIGVRNSDNNTKIISFLDDDVTLKDNYFEEIIDVFNKNNKAKAVAAYNQVHKSLIESNLYRNLKKLFFLGYLEKSEKARMLSAYGNTYPEKLKNTINSEWLPGVNISYLKEVFTKDKMGFDENLLGYTVAEDIDFSYRLFKKYPKGLFITPNTSVIHRISVVEREPTERLSYINQVDHFYFNLKNMNSNLKEKVIFLWSLFGISILRTLQFVVKPNKTNSLKLKFFFKSFFYCISHIESIKGGKLRNF